MKSFPIRSVALACFIAGTSALPAQAAPIDNQLNGCAFTPSSGDSTPEAPFQGMITGITGTPDGNDRLHFWQVQTGYPLSNPNYVGDNYLDPDDPFFTEQYWGNPGFLTEDAVMTLTYYNLIEVNGALAQGPTKLCELTVTFTAGAGDGGDDEEDGGGGNWRSIDLDRYLDRADVNSLPDTL
jgi:hypothetical protein